MEDQTIQLQQEVQLGAMLVQQQEGEDDDDDDEGSGVSALSSNQL